MTHPVWNLFQFQRLFIVLTKWYKAFVWLIIIHCFPQNCPGTVNVSTQPVFVAASSGENYGFSYEWERILGHYGGVIM